MKTIKLLCILLTSFAAGGHQPGMAQDEGRLFPDRSLLPSLMAGPRDPVIGVHILWVADNPNAHGTGVEVEAALGTQLPILLLSGDSDENPVVVGIEAGVFARFGLQVLERELIGSDWVFAIPVVWYRPWGWMRFRYYHASSHMGDEYARRFNDPGINFSRDAAEGLILRRFSPGPEVYGGVRYAYTVHPEDSRRWVLRAGAQMEGREVGQTLRPFGAADVEWDEDAGPRPRLEARVGMWLPPIRNRRSIRVSLGLLTGPSPMGQFNGSRTTQVGLGLHGTL